MLRKCTALIVALLFLSACGSSNKKTSVRYGKKGSSTKYYPKSIDDIIYDNLGHRSDSGITYARSLKTDKNFTIPYEYNSYVEKWVNYFTGRGRKSFARHLARLGRFMPYIHAVTDQYGVPRDLVYLSMIESGFNLRARSWASAVGPWQFIRSTGAMYGLSVDYYIDERRDIQKSTHAAVRHLRDLYNQFGHWYLAFAAYNAGPGKVNGAIRRDGKNYWNMVRGRYLRQETKDYVPKLLAAAMIAKNPEKYGFRSIRYQKPIAFEEVRLKGPTDLEVAAECAGVHPDLIRLLNPELLRDMTPPHIPNYRLKIPKGTESRFSRNYAKLRPQQRVRMHEYVAQRGDSVRTIARNYGVTEKDLAEANPGKINISKHSKVKKVKVRYRRKGKRRYRWKNRRYTVRSYTVSSGTRLTIPKNRSLAKYSSFRDDAAAYGAERQYAVNFSSKHSSSRSKGKKLSKKELRRLEKQKKEELKAAKIEAKKSKKVTKSDLPVLRTAKSDLPLETFGTSPTRFESGASTNEDTAPSDSELKAAVAKLPVKSDLPDVASDPENRREWTEEKTAEAPAPKPKPEPTYHQVQRGETLGKIAKRYGVKRKDLIAWNGKKVHPVLQAGAKIKINGPKGASAPAAKPKYYRVKSGDTLSEIANAHGVSVSKLKEWNGKAVYPVLKKGSKISVRGPSAAVAKSKVVKYKVKKGDSLYKIAKKHKTTPDQIKKLNGIKGTTIRPGAILVVRRK